MHEMSTSLARNTSPDANVLHWLNHHQFDVWCQRIVDQFVENEPHPTLHLATLCVSAFPVTTGADTWKLLEVHDGWEVYLRDTLIAVAYVDYADAHVELAIPGPSDHGMFR